MLVLALCQQTLDYLSQSSFSHAVLNHHPRLKQISVSSPSLSLSLTLLLSLCTLPKFRQKVKLSVCVYRLWKGVIKSIATKLNFGVGKSRTQNKLIIKRNISVLLNWEKREKIEIETYRRDSAREKNSDTKIEILSTEESQSKKSDYKNGENNMRRLPQNWN